MPAFPALEPATAPWSPRFMYARLGSETTSWLRVAGELDIASVPQLDQALFRAEAGAEVVVLDLRPLEFIDVSSARVLLAAHRRIRRAGGRLVVVRPASKTDSFFELLGLDRELELVDGPFVGRNAAI